MSAREFQNSSTTSDNDETDGESSSSIQELNILYMGSITGIFKDQPRTSMYNTASIPRIVFV